MTTPARLGFDAILRGPDGVATGDITFGARIDSITPGPGRADRLVLPALANAHDHGRGLRTAAFGAGDDLLEVWIARLALEPRVDAYTRAAVAFGRLALSGVAVLNHCHNTQDPAALLAEAAAVARAAADVGLRVAFAVPIMGHNPVAYGDPGPLLSRLPPAARAAAERSLATPPDWDHQMDQAEAIFAMQTPHFLPQYGPVGPQWVDDATLARIAARSAETGRRVHMHLLETQAQREWADATYPGGLIPRLDALGLLSPRLTVAHGVHLRPDEIALLADRGVMVSVNTSSNLRLRSGIAPVADFVAKGLGFGMGMDGMAFDDDEDCLRELRLLWQLQRGFGLTETLDPARLWQTVTQDGRRAILGPGDDGGTLTPGAPADILTLSTARIMADAIPGRTDAATLALLRARKEDVTDLHVMGRAVVRDGRLTGIDLPAAEAALIAEARANAPALDHAALAAVDAACRHYLATGCHCMGGQP
jgi:cytosine/adenosine deaminase-related metal-dependent hydrolase